MGGDWPIVPFHDVIAIQRGHDLPEQARKHGDVPVIGSAGQNGWHDRALAAAPGLAIGRSGASAGVVTFVDRDFWPHNTCLYVTDFKGNEPRFLYHLLATANLANHAGGSAQPSLNRNHLANLPLLLPPIKEQQAIAELLGALDDKIEVNRRMAETVEATARALFKSWFVDFDPVSAHAEGRAPTLPQPLAALFANHFADDGLPEGWHDLALGEMVVSERATVEPSKLGPQLVDHFSLPAFDTGRRPTLESAERIKSLKLSLRAPVVLYAKLNPDTPRVWPILSDTGRAMLGSTEFLALRPTRTTNFSFVMSLLLSDPLRQRAAGMVTGTSKSHQRVQPASLLATKWPMPPAALLHHFDQAASPLFSRADNARRESDTLAALRDALLPKLISGELRIRDAERAVAAA